MNSADTADQMTKMTLEGIEVAANIALKAGGEAAKSIAVYLYAVLTDKKKIKGKTQLNALLKSGKELKVFAIHHDDLKKFCEAAKNYGVLYSVLKEKGNQDGIIDIMVRSEDASKISRIVDKFDLATIDTKAIKKSIEAQSKIDIISDKEHEDLVKNLMNQTNPTQARTSDIVFEQSSKISRKESVRKHKGKGTSDLTKIVKPSVREKLQKFAGEKLKSASPKINIKNKDISKAR